MARIKADVRREEILRATCREVIARGFASTRVGDVAAALGVSTGLVFYHFTNKETLLGEAFRYAAGEDLDRLSATAAGDGSAAQRLDRILQLYSPAGSSEAWLLWIDAWGQALRSPELAEVSRQLDLRWKQTLAAVIREGVAAGEFTCPDPDAAAWRLTALLDGLGVQVTVHRSVPTTRLVDWVRSAAAAELSVDPATLAEPADRRCRSEPLIVGRRSTPRRCRTPAGGSERGNDPRRLAMAVQLQVVFDAADPPPWPRSGEAVGYRRRTRPAGSTAGEAGGGQRPAAGGVGQLRLAGRSRRRRAAAVLPARPEPKTAKNRVHLDLSVSGGRGTPMEEAPRQRRRRGRALSPPGRPG